MWIYILLGIIALIILGMVSKAVAGLGFLFKIIIFPFTALLAIVKFIFKK